MGKLRAVMLKEKLGVSSKPVALQTLLPVHIPIHGENPSLWGGEAKSHKDFYRMNWVFKTQYMITEETGWKPLVNIYFDCYSTHNNWDVQSKQSPPFLLFSDHRGTIHESNQYLDMNFPTKVFFL